MHSLRTAFLIGGPLALLLASLAGYALAGAALRPIEAMRRRAQEISTSSLHERLPVPAADDEVARLGETLNEMLARIEAGLERERRFVADASHELRTPLALLKTELELALRRSRTPEELEQAIRSAAAESDRLGRIADDLLLLARSEDGRLPLRLEPVDVDDLLESVAARFQARAEAEHRALDAAQRLGPRRRRRPPAARAGAGEHGRQRIRARNGRDPADRSAPQRLRRAARARTTGRASRRSSSTTRSSASAAPTRRATRGGSGLGLAIVDTVARAHRGSAHAANREDGGADVWLTLGQA